MNIFSQRIAIWYAPNDINIAIDIMHSIKDMIDDCYIDKILVGHYQQMKIILKDGTSIQLVCVDTDACGYRFSTSFIINRDHISDNVIRCKIIARTILGARDVCDLLYGNDHEIERSIWYRRRIG